MDEQSREFEKRAHDAYARFGGLAKRYYHVFSRSAVTCGEVPTMLFLGNHSSGKSSLVNWTLGGEPVQDVGLAPTDDGFTVILYGEREEDVTGPAAISRLPPEFRALDVFGGTFLQHLKVKVRNREVLKGVTFVDSPGMIDSAEGEVSRTYDFAGVVKVLTGLCDMVFFLLDPDKPGTTGETISIFSRCLVGAEFKLRVLLNKCDAFAGVYDFARTYGTVCWNLARVLRTKDLPKIWTVYSGAEKTGDSQGLDLSDCNRHREEYLDVIRHAAARRKDNVFSQMLSDFLGLSVRMCVVNAAARRLTAFVLAASTFAALLLVTFGFVGWHLLVTRMGWGATVSATAVAVCAVLGAFVAYWTIRFLVRLQRVSLAGKVDSIFGRLYRRRLVLGVHDNLDQNWEAVRDETAEVIRQAPLDLPLFGEFRRRRLEAAVKKLCESFHGKAKSKG